MWTLLAACMAELHGWRATRMLRKARRAEARARRARGKAVWWWARAGPGVAPPEAQ